MNQRDDSYTDLKGRAVSLAELDGEERQLLTEFQALADSLARRPARPGFSKWPEFRNHWMAKVAELYGRRRLSRREMTATALYRIAQDMGNRIAIEEGTMRAPDYRDELEEIIRTRFSTRREFCEATGLTEDMLSHVLARRKHLAIDTLADALARIGYGVHIRPLEDAKA